MTRLIFVDVETTGTNPELHHLWEIGLVVRDLSGQHDTDRPVDVEYAWQVGPDLETAEPQALRVGRFYQRNKVRYQGGGRRVEHPNMNRLSNGGVTTSANDTGGSAHTVAAEVAELVDGAVLAGINVGFDAVFLGKFLRGYGQCGTWNYHLVELLSLAAGWLAGQGRPVRPPWTSTTITEALGLPEEADRHTALGDARLNAAIYDAVMHSG